MDMVSNLGDLKFLLNSDVDGILYGFLSFGAFGGKNQLSPDKAFVILENAFPEMRVQKYPYDPVAISKAEYKISDLPVFGQLAFLQHMLQETLFYKDLIIIHKGETAFRKQDEDGSLEIVVFQEETGHGVGEGASAYYYTYNRNDFLPENFNW